MPHHIPHISLRSCIIAQGRDISEVRKTHSVIMKKEECVVQCEAGIDDENEGGEMNSQVLISLKGSGEGSRI